LLIVSDPTRRGLVAAQRIGDLRKELDIHVEESYLIINRLRGEIPVEVADFAATLGVPLLGTAPEDADLAVFESSGKPLVDLGDDSPVYQAVGGMMRRILAI
jgi:CO dehydrogenase maturation factor